MTEKKAEAKKKRSAADKANYGFGFDPKASQNHFYVVIPPRASLKSEREKQRVQVYERFKWTDTSAETSEVSVQDDKENSFPDGQKLEPADVLRIEVPYHKWEALANDVAGEFNARLKADHKKIGKFSGNVPLEKMFGKELMVLLWAIENVEPVGISRAVTNWKGLQPEERWWLYTMTNASTGGIHDGKLGWRMALHYALCFNPIMETSQTEMLI